MSIIKTIALLFCGAGLVFSCSNEQNKGCHTLEDVDYIKRFPKEIKTDVYIEDRYDLTGAISLFIDDSILYVAKMGAEHYIYAFDIDAGNLIGSFLKNGNGPGELLAVPALSISSLKKDNGLVFSIIDGRGHLLDINFSESLKKGKTVLVGTEDVPTSNLMHCIKLDDRYGIYCTTLKPRFTGINRFIYYNGEQTSIPPLEELNKNVINKEGDSFLFNLVGVMANCNTRLNRMVEVSIYLNTIHLYDVDGPFAKTICMGKQLSDIEALEEAGPTGMKTINGYMMTFRDFFAILHQDKEDEKSVCIFDWEGKPLGKIYVDSGIDSFDIDVKRGKLFALKNATEELLIYDIRELGAIVINQERV